MNRVYKFVAGNSRITPLGIAIALAAGLLCKNALGWWSAPVYLAILAATLALSTLEPVQ